MTPLAAPRCRRMRAARLPRAWSPSAGALLPLLGVLPALGCARQEPAPRPCPTNEAAGEVQAEVAGQLLDEAAVAAVLGDKLTSALAEQRQELFRLRWYGLEQLIDERLLAAEAARRQLTVDDLLQREVDALVGEPSEDEARAFYEQHAHEIQLPFEMLQERIVALLRDQRRERSRTSFLARLRHATPVAYRLRPPPLPRELVPLPDGASWGAPEAAVTVIEFSSYRCPYCADMSRVLTEELAEYGGQVRRVFRNFLAPDNERGIAAAVASLCARRQGRFWPLHEKLFANQQSLSDTAITAWAEEVGLDAPSFAACRSDPAVAARIAADRQDGLALKIDGTPTIFINGQRLVGLQPAPLIKAYIEAELRR